MTNELDAWRDEAPAIASGNPEFEAWLDDVPVVDIPSEGTAGEVSRRRAFYF